MAPRSPTLTSAGPPLAPPTMMATSSPKTIKRKASLPGPERNIDNVVLGDILFKTWYPSFYPDELVGRERAERLYVCRWCFRYSKELMPYLGHVVCRRQWEGLGNWDSKLIPHVCSQRVCKLRESLPLGRMIWAKGCYSVWEVDGEEHKVRMIVEHAYKDIGGL